MLITVSFEESEKLEIKPRLELRLVDQLGRAWPASFLSGLFAQKAMRVLGVGAYARPQG